MIKFPYQFADAGNFVVQAGETITLTWEAAPPNAERYEFVAMDKSGHSLGLGVDTQAADGVAIAWIVPERFNGILDARAYFPDGCMLHPGYAGELYSGELPPANSCSLRVESNGVVNLYPEPTLNVASTAYLMPGPYAQVYERTAEGWYRVDNQVATDPNTGQAPPGPTWVKVETGLPVSFFGPCKSIPVIIPAPTPTP